jgi:hypothetical protein
MKNNLPTFSGLPETTKTFMSKTPMTNNLNKFFCKKKIVLSLY